MSILANLPPHLDYLEAHPRRRELPTQRGNEEGRHEVSWMQAIERAKVENTVLKPQCLNEPHNTLSLKCSQTDPKIQSLNTSKTSVSENSSSKISCETRNRSHWHDDSSDNACPTFEMPLLKIATETIEFAATITGNAEH